MTSPVELIQQWLGCDEEAGRQVWFQPVVLPAATIFDVYKGKAMKEGWGWVASGLNIEYCDLESEATGAVLKVHDRLKRGGEVGGGPEEIREAGAPRARGGACASDKDSTDAVGFAAVGGGRPGHRYRFSSVGEFLAYLNDSIPGAMSDLLIKMQRERRGGPWPVSQRPPADPPYEPITPPKEAGPVDVSGDPNAYQKLRAKQRREFASRLVNAFRGCLGRQRSLPEHLAGLVTAFKEERDVPDEAVAEEVIDFLDDKGRHRCHVTRWFLQREISEDNYYQRNRRLRKEWRAFRDGQGKPDYAAYQDLRS
mgnify:CR=1 FL=1